MYTRITPRNGHTVHIGIVARISGCQNQKELSLTDQVDHAKEEARHYCDATWPVEYHVISTKGKGESLDRPELKDIEALLRSQVLDILIVEDIGRLIRGAAAVALCGIAVDNKVRVLSPNECIDTFEPNWEEDVIGAARDHVSHNSHTSKRLKHKMMNRFVKHGASMARPIYGYLKPTDARTYNDWQKDDKATPILVELFQRYLRTPNFSQLAVWLTQSNVPTGPYDRTKRWESAKVRRLMSNPLLKGIAWRGCRHTVKHHQSGKRISVKKPGSPSYYPCAHLAHIPPELWDQVNELREIRNQGLGRKAYNGNDPREGVSRKRTIFPGQHARCGICNRLFYWGGHGKKYGMMCSGVRDYQCWNAITADGIQASMRITRAVLHSLSEMPEFDRELMKRLKEQAELHLSKSSAQETQLQSQVDKLNKRIENLVHAMSQTGFDEEFKAAMLELKSQRNVLSEQLVRIRSQPKQVVELPSMSTLRERAQTAIQALAMESPEFGQLMNQVVTKLCFFPFRICDGNRMVIRAKFTINLDSFVCDATLSDEAVQALSRDVVVDLYDLPQRVLHREAIVALTQQGFSIKEAARRTGITSQAAQNALKLHKVMMQQGLSDPFVALDEPPADDTRLKRHLHPRYRFNPLT